MTAKYEKKFTVAVSVERAWKAFVDPREREVWMVPPGGDPMERDESSEEKVPYPVDQVKLGKTEEHKLLQWSELRTGAPDWIETTVVFEEKESGTTITITRSGFGDSEDMAILIEATGYGWDEAVADLVLYLETGIKAWRHFTFRGSVAASFREIGCGVEVAAVIPGGYAAQAGLQTGDLLLRLNGAPVTRTSDVWFLQREHDPGTEIDVQYVRSGEVKSGRAALSPFMYS
jgi:uncharacterized protein YndB with AHSA1/START domain